MRGSLADAEKDFETAANLAPNKSLPYFALGWVWVQSAQTDKAVRVLREKSKLPGMDFLVPYIFGVALVHSGADAGTPAADEAVAAFESSIRLNSNFSHSHAELGKLLFKLGEVDRAITELKAATTLDPGDSGPVYVLAQAYRKKGPESPGRRNARPNCAVALGRPQPRSEERIEAAGQAGHDSVLTNASDTLTHGHRARLVFSQIGLPGECAPRDCSRGRDLCDGSLCRRPEFEEYGRAPIRALEFRNAAPGVRYVGSNMCKGCHSAIYQQYSRTDMAHSTSLPGSILDKGWLAKPVDIFNQKLDRHYQVFARDGKVYQSEYGLDQQGKEVFRHTEELAYVVGTGANGVTPISPPGQLFVSGSGFLLHRKEDVGPFP